MSPSTASSSSFSLAPRDIDPGPFHSTGLLALTIVGIVAIMLGIAFVMGLRCCCCAKKAPRNKNQRCHNDVENNMTVTMPVPEPVPETTAQPPHWYGQQPGEVSTPSTDSEMALKEPLGSPPPYSPPHHQQQQQQQQPELPAPVVMANGRGMRSVPRGYQEVEARPAAPANHHEVK